MNSDEVLAQISRANRAVIKAVTNEILAEVKGGESRFDGGDNEARFAEVPHYESLVITHHRDLLCLPD